MSTARLPALCLVALLLLPVVVAAEEAFIVEMEGYTLRSAPKVSGLASGRVKVGTRVLVTGRTSGWVQVEAGDQKGWLSESAVGSELPASVRLGPVQERVAALETNLQTLEAEKKGLQEENARLGSRVGELEQSFARAKKEAVDARATGRFREMALGGGLVILGWLAGYALRRRGGSSRYRIQ